MAILFFSFLIAFNGPAQAGQAEVRNVALINNCAPKKIEVYQQALGAEGDTIYRVQCTLPKTVGTASGTTPPDGLLVSCKMNLCEMLRPVTIDKK